MKLYQPYNLSWIFVNIFFSLREKAPVFTK